MPATPNPSKSDYFCDWTGERPALPFAEGTLTPPVHASPPVHDSLEDTSHRRTLTGTDADELWSLRWSKWTEFAPPYGK